MGDRSTGYGLSGDAYHVALPRIPKAAAAELAMRMALKEGWCFGPGEIDYINAHGTSPMADTHRTRRDQARAGRRSLGRGLNELDAKAAIGHLLGGAGAVEAIFCILAYARPDRAADAQPR